jgi:hypothetical protein
MLAFFERHGLPTNAEDYGADPELRQLATGLHRERGPLSAMAQLEEASSAIPAPNESGPVRRLQPAAASEHEPGAGLLEAVATQPSAAGARPRSQRVLGYGLVALAIAAALGWGYSFQRESQLEDDLRRSRQQLRTTDHALSALERRAEGLRGELQQSEVERAALSSRFEQFAADAERRRAAEEETLKQMLGKRYEKLRNQALGDGTPPR